MSAAHVIFMPKLMDGLVLVVKRKNKLNSIENTSLQNSFKSYVEMPPKILGQVMEVVSLSEACSVEQLHAALSAPNSAPPALHDYQLISKSLSKNVIVKTHPHNFIHFLFQVSFHVLSIS